MLYILSLLLLSQPQQMVLGGDEFLKVLEGLHSPIKDYEFVCEGETKWLVDTTAIFHIGVDNQSGRFQGAYAYRQDGAAYWDLYFKPFDAHGYYQHNTYIQLKGRRYRAYRAPDRQSQPEPVRVDAGSPDNLGAPYSPQLFILLGYWRRLGYQAKDIKVESTEWVDLDGGRVLLVTIDEAPNLRNPKVSKRWSKYWVDLRRGGHVVKHERLRGSHLLSRTSGVELASISLPRGVQVWLPIHGEFETFWWPKGYSDTPVFHETYGVVRGSIVVNSGLSDERFSMEWEGHGAVSKGLEKARREFQAAPAMPAPPQLRTDPAGVEEYQKKRLAEADRQARQLDASPPSRRGWDLGLLMQASLTLLGIGTLIAAFLLRRRTS